MAVRTIRRTESGDSFEGAGHVLSAGRRKVVRSRRRRKRRYASAVDRSKCLIKTDQDGRARPTSSNAQRLHGISILQDVRGVSQGL